MSKATGKRYRHDIDAAEERKIIKAIKNGTSIRSLSTRYQCSEGLIRQIRDGCRVRPPKRKHKNEIPPDELCTCCGTRPKKDGNRYLCDVCYRNADDDPHVGYHSCPTMTRGPGGTRKGR